jgi:hypothetical protein
MGSSSLRVFGVGVVFVGLMVVVVVVLLDAVGGDLLSLM